MRSNNSLIFQHYYFRLFYFIIQIRKSFFAELGFYENDTLVRIMYEDFIKGTMDADERDKSPPETDPKRTAFYEVRKCCKSPRKLKL